MSHEKKRVVVFTAGALQRDVELFLDRLSSSDHVELVAVVVDKWKKPWKRLRFLLKRWGLSTFALSLAYRTAAACNGMTVFRKWHDCFMPTTRVTTYEGLAYEHNIELIYSDDINSKQSASEIAKFDPDLGVIVGGRILKDRITNIPRLGTLNIHKHDATKYRGSPQIGFPERMHGDATLDVTIHFATSKVDQGDIVKVARIPIEACDDDRSLAIKGSVHGLQAYQEAVEAVATGQFTRIPQQASSGTTYVTTPYVQRVRFWRKYRKRIGQSIDRPGTRLRTRVLAGTYRSGRFAACMTALPWLAHRRRQQEAEGKAPIVVFYYHGIGNGGENWMTWPLHRFHEDVTYLQKHFKIISLEEAVERLRSGVNHETAAVLTFDDGYRSCYENLLPYLNYYRIPATIFACPGASTVRALHSHDIQNDCLGAHLMTEQQLADCTGEFVELGSHGDFHEDMGRLNGVELERAIVGSGDALERITQHDIRYFSFPFGKKHHMSVEALRRGRKKYDAMFSAYGGYNFPDTDTWSHFQRIANPHGLRDMIAIMSGLHRLRPFYVDRPADFCDVASAKSRSRSRSLEWKLWPTRPRLSLGKS